MQLNNQLIDRLPENYKQLRKNNYLIVQGQKENMLLHLNNYLKFLFVLIQKLKIHSLQMMNLRLP